jgi:hypothetical protein
VDARVVVVLVVVSLVVVVHPTQVVVVDVVVVEVVVVPEDEEYNWLISELVKLFSYTLSSSIEPLNMKSSADS